MPCVSSTYAAGGIAGYKATCMGPAASGIAGIAQYVCKECYAPDHITELACMHTRTASSRSSCRRRMRPPHTRWSSRCAKAPALSRSSKLTTRCGTSQDGFVLHIPRDRTRTCRAWMRQA